MKQKANTVGIDLAKHAFEFIPIYESVITCSSDGVISSQEVHAMAAIWFVDV